ncbi:hypothetical protein SNOG_11755 [Parastagonospora nodorum SN15]|uniref:non-specific serine/threonine protein kinase n=1 Tax=Phaeosphaeria nodorum (strain SN15 / ATCC MYA-4574 / FGSC 10173) TaxID=321614 RepID=Q0U909_PHANO|nr:hypothetical protein SNOG_11755 [Parastagonospora nodorum SN15]EAT80799.2 hypothetical protein SNOG_11755 [Parastagonospora nodorum SN15]
MAFAHNAFSTSQPMAQHRAPAPIAVSNAPPGTFAPGTKVQVGGHRVTIERYLSEGGFAHVYLVRVPRADGRNSDVAVLKRVAAPDKDALGNMRTEVETMKKLKGHHKIVTYMDSHASQLKGGGYEVFLLMEYCSGGGLIDFMNTRLQHRLTEPEILHIFSDVAEGVATMHYLKPPLLHRDLKVENVLITTVSGNKIYKLCDFGSTAPPRPAATTAAEGRLIEDDVQRHTTLQYRSPEMIDVYRKQPIDEKSDIWALGVLLYKLCYYTTPFEEVGQMAILNATFKYPSYPQFSDRIKKLIGWMLRESPQHRPNIYQVVSEVCSMRHRAVPIKDLPPTEPDVASPPTIGLQKVAPVKQVQQIPDITPMRRGRPTGPAQQPPAAKPSASPMRGTASDPFAALDSQDVQVRRAAADELASRFPSLDEFSLLHDRGQKFEFGQAPTPTEPALNNRVVQALADDAFASVSTTNADRAPSPTKPRSNVPSTVVSRTASIKKPKPSEVKDSPRSSAPAIAQPVAQRVGMVSTGVQTSPRASPVPTQQKLPDINNRPRPSAMDLGSSLDRSKSANSNARPASMYVESNLDYLRDREMAPGRKFDAPSLQRRITSSAIDDSPEEEKNVRSSIDFLRAIEREDHPENKHKHRRSSSQSKHVKRGSLSSLAGNTKNIVKGRFGDAFRRFESNKTPEHERDQPPLTPTDQLIDPKTGNAALTPIAGSEATGGLSDDDRSAIDETLDLPPEVRRDLERRRLSEEERRVSAAAAEYRQRISSQGSGKPKVPTKAAYIQNRVKNLLDESSKPTQVNRTAEGYGKYTDTSGSHVRQTILREAQYASTRTICFSPASNESARTIRPCAARAPETEESADWGFGQSDEDEAAR